MASDPNQPPAKKRRFEDRFEAVLFGSRWLAAPIYLGLIFALIMLLAVFTRRMLLIAPTMLNMELDEAVLATLTFIDIALVANLILIVILAGYENFVSKIDTENHEDRPEWMGTIDFSGLKLKLFASIVAITGIELLKAFMAVGRHGSVPENSIRWLVIIHITFLATAVLSAVTDWFTAKARAAKYR
jgi:uncharacterized protein (TIGR00645 family)